MRRGATLRILECLFLATALAVAGLSPGLAHPPAAAAASLFYGYDVTDLGAYSTGAGSGSEAWDINDNGEVVGVSWESGGANKVAFTWSGGTMTALTPLAGDTNAEARGVNNAGEVVGFSDFGAGYHHAWLSSGGTMTNLGYLDVQNKSEANGINDHGQVVGLSQRLWCWFGICEGAGTITKPYSHAVLYNSDDPTPAMIDLGAFAPEFDAGTSEADRINETGQVAGTSQVRIAYTPPDSGMELYRYPHHAYLWKPSSVNGSAGTMVDLGTFTSITDLDAQSFAYGISPKGRVVGWADTTGGDTRTGHAFVWAPTTFNGTTGTMFDLGTLPGGTRSEAWDINDTDIVGWSYTSSGAQHAFVYDWGFVMRMYDLNDLTAPGWTLAQARAINSSGQIVGWGTNPAGEHHAFLATPTKGDTTAPIVTATPTGGQYTSSQSVTLTCNEVPCTVRYTLDGTAPTATSTAYSAPISMTAASTTLKYYGVDGNGNASAVGTQTYGIDVGTNVDITSRPPNPTSWTTPQIQFFSTDTNVATWECKVDGGAYAPCEPHTYYFTTPLSDGSHTFSVRVTDTANNTATDSYTWVTDTQTNVTITAKPSDPSSVLRPSFSFSSTDSNLDSFQCKLDDGDYAACASPFTPAADLTAGSHTFTVQAKDRLANTATAGYTWTISELPMVTVLTVNGASGTYGGAADLSARLTRGGTGVAGETIAFSLNGSAVGTAQTDASGVASLPAVSLHGIDGGTYPAAVSASFAGDATYRPSGGSATLTVGPADATITVTPYSLLYDGAQHAATGTATGLDGEDLGGLLDLSGTRHTNAGDYAEDAWTFSGNANYRSTAGTVHDVITQATSSMTVSCTATVSGVGDLSQVLAVTYFGRNGTTYNSSTPPTIPGEYTAFGRWDGDANHAGSTDSVDFNVVATVSTVELTCPASVVYDGEAQEPCTAEVTGEGGLSQSVVVQYLDNVDAGTATASASFAGDGTYAASDDSAEFTIERAAVTATAGSGTTVYDGSKHDPSACALTGAYTGGLGCSNDPGSVGPGQGTWAIHPVISGDGLDNFNVTGVDGIYSIAKATLTITAGDQEMAFGDAVPAPTFGYSGFAPGETLATSGVTGTPECTIEAGPYTVPDSPYAITCTQGSLEAGNYDFDFVPGALTVNPVDPTFGFDLSTLPAKTFGDASFGVAGYVDTNSSGAVTFALGSGSTGCSVTSAGVVTLTGAALDPAHCVIRAALAAAGNYLAAGPESESFNIAKATASVTYTGPTYRLLAAGVTSTAVTLTATVSPGICSGDLSFSVRTGPADTPVAGSGPTYTLATGLYWIEATVEGPGCTGGPDEATISIVSAGDKSNGGGWYKADTLATGSPRVNFGYTLQASSSTDRKSGVTTTTYRGQLLWLNNGQWRLKGTVSGQTTTTGGVITGTPPYGTFTCPAGFLSTLPAGSAGTACGSLTGSGVLQYWDATALAWKDSTDHGTVTFTATVYDGGQAKVCKSTGRKTTCSTVDNPDAFGIQIDGVSAYEIRESAPVELSGGAIKAG